MYHASLFPLSSVGVGPRAMFCPDKLATGVLAVSSAESCLVGVGTSRGGGSILSAVVDSERDMDVPRPPPPLCETEVRRGELVLTGEGELLLLLREPEPPPREVARLNRGVVSPEIEFEEDEPGVMVDERDRTGVIGSCIPEVW